MASEEDHTVYGEEELDEDDEESEDEEDLTLTHPQQNDDVDDEDDDVDVDDDEEDLNSPFPSPSPSSADVTIAVPGDPPPTVLDSDPKRQSIEQVNTVVEEKKPSALDESRRLFQRLWTDEDEIELLQGFLDYTTQRGTINSSHHHDTALFYDQIKCKLQLDFNKNQLVEKLRRLKKKYRNVVARISSGKEFSFKSPHDQATFEISRKIWSGATAAAASATGLEDDESNPNPNPNPNPNNNDYNNNGVGVDANSLEKKAAPRSRKRSRVKIEEKHAVNNQSVSSSIPNLIEDTVRSCLSPLFKELLHNAMGGPCGGGRGFGGVALNPLPLSFGGPGMNFSSGETVVDEKWRKQQMLELEVYSKRLELVQDQIKSALEELRSMGS